MSTIPGAKPGAIPGVIPGTKINSGASIPALGYGVAMLDDPKELERSIHTAIEAGYRFFDLAPAYGNEAAVGKALRSSGIPREELFISTKLRNHYHAFDKAMESYKRSIAEIGVEYLDQYIIHWPMPMFGLAHEAWRALESLHKDGLARTIGLSNFSIAHIEKLLETAEIMPMTIEYECNPYYTREAERAYCKEKGIRIISWFPLGGPPVGREPFPQDDNGPLMEHRVVKELAGKYSKSSAQILLRWGVEADLIPIPKSAKRERIFENADIFDFSLSKEDIGRLDALNVERRFGPDPETFDKDE